MMLSAAILQFAWHFMITASASSGSLMPNSVNVYSRKPHPSVKGVPNKISTVAEQVSQSYGVPAPLLLAVAKVESQFNAHAVSPCGAQGIMQLMPETASLLHVKDAFNVLESMQGAAQYLLNMTLEYGNVKQAIFAYNTGHAGSAWQVAHSPYVQAVWHDYQQFRGAKSWL